MNTTKKDSNYSDNKLNFLAFSGTIFRCGRKGQKINIAMEKIKVIN